MQFGALPFSADSTMSIGSRKWLRERCTYFLRNTGIFWKRYGAQCTAKVLDERDEL
jgi:hypothetical protein